MSQDQPFNHENFPEALKPFLGKVVEIPLACIHANPDNPGPEITEEMVADMAANIAEVGLRNPIKVMLRWDAPLREGVVIHPENPLLKADGSPLWVGDFHYINLSGQLRYLAFEKLGRGTIPSNILNPTPEEAVIITRTDNDVRDRGWWADYQTIENLIKANPNQSQKRVAAKLKLDNEKVNRAIRLLPLLNPEARGLIGRNTANSNKGIWHISDNAAARLADLGPESTFKPGAKSKTLPEGEQAQKLWPYSPIPPETQDLVRQALEVALDRQMTEAQVKKLVEWIKGGQKAEEFNPQVIPKAKRQPAVGSPQHAVSPSSASGVSDPKGSKPSSVQQSTHNRQSNDNPSATTSPEHLKSRLNEAMAGGSPLTLGEKLALAGQGLGRGVQKLRQFWAQFKGSPAGVKGFEKAGKWAARIFWHGSLKQLHHFFRWVANLVVPLHHSSHSGHRYGGGNSSGSTNPVPVVLHWGVYSLCQLVFGWVVLGKLATHFAPGLKPWVEFPFRYLAYLLAVDFPAWVLRLAEEHLVWAIIGGLVLLYGIGRAFQAQRVRTVVLLALLGAVWFYGRGWGREKLPTSTPVDSRQSSADPDSLNPPLSPQPRQASGPRVTSERPATAVEPRRHEETKKDETGGKKTKSPVFLTSASTNLSTKPWQSADESKDYLEAEIAAIRLPAKIKAFIPEPDSMSGEMATRRLGDLQDPEKYSLIVGHDRQKVLSVSPAGSGFTLSYGDAFPIGGLLGGPQKIEFYWEDVKAIHCDEIQTGVQRIYQCGLVVNGLKNHFTFQCASADDLRHLVSALEFWIKAGNKGKEAPLGGMPYLTQGLRLDEKGKVAALWAATPASLAVELGDFVWSLDVDSKQPQGKPYLESALDSLAQGKHLLYVVTPADWGNGPPAKNSRNAQPFNPKRQKMELVVQ